MDANTFVNQYEVIRELMHAILRYGTLTPDELPVSASKYNKMKPLLEASMQDNIEDRRYQKGMPRSLHITADTFSEGLSALCNTYMVKSITVSELCIRLLILQLLQENGRMTAQALTEEISGLFSENTDERTVIRQCQHLTEYGQISAEMRNRRTVYSASDPAAVIGDLTGRLIELTGFLRLFAAPAVCGEQLYRSLCSLSGVQPSENHFLVTGIHIGYVLDDAVLYDLLCAIENRQIISFNYTDQNREHPDFSRILPLKIHSSEPLGRRYLVALDLNASGQMILCRLDFIRKIRIVKEKPCFSEDEINEMMHHAFRYSVSGAHLPNGEPAAVRLQYQPEFEPVLRKHFPHTAEYSQENGKCIVTVTVNHPLELKAFLRENAGSVQALRYDSNTLCEDMQAEARLWRERYGIES